MHYNLTQNSFKANTPRQAYIHEIELTLYPSFRNIGITYGLYYVSVSENEGYFMAHRKLSIEKELLNRNWKIYKNF